MTILGPSPQSVVFRQRCHSSAQVTLEVLKCLYPAQTQRLALGFFPKTPIPVSLQYPALCKTQGMFGKGLSPAFSWASSWRKEESRAERTSSGSPELSQPAWGHLQPWGCSEDAYTQVCSPAVHAKDAVAQRTSGCHHACRTTATTPAQGAASPHSPGKAHSQTACPKSSKRPTVSVPWAKSHGFMPALTSLPLLLPPP